ncbi:PTS glucose transporter subunit IIABC [Mesoplasma florum]|uniref:PTS glucose transporter subunit IIABC n=1 Tax=Mesoplasma florum TaxID=2151 RepID=UPI000BE41C3F|nr:PTS glucose transporter subunit IIABC [Mesoplasma florum]ATI72966.1 hypothetical protein CQZ69_00060 [Mesoplasma florum]AVN61369.1 hypothetical protein CG004_00060 [Mesoplasma florum]
MEIKIYAPINCRIKKLDKCFDQTFAQKLMGDGILIEPLGSEFCLPFKEASVSLIFDTKHAYVFNVEGVEFLLHCGLDTVKLNGKGFETKIKNKQKLRKGDPLFEVDLKFMKSKKISLETPLIVIPDNIENISIGNFEEKEYKKGELICVVEVEIKEQQKTVVSDPQILFANVNKYESEAREINKFVGSPSNYSDYYNCMTRLRFKITDKNLVNESEIKKMPICKGIVWSGNEFQVIIGQDVYKVKDELTRQNEYISSIANNAEEFNKKTIGKRFFSMFASIAVKVIPSTIGLGLIQALISVLVLFGAMPNISIAPVAEGSSQIWLLDPTLNIFWVILFITGRTGAVFMGIVFAYSAADYFKFNKILALTIATILCSPLIFYDGGQLGMGYEWILFRWLPLNTGNYLVDKIGNFTVSLLSIKIFVLIGAIYFAKKVDDFLNGKIPVSLDLMFRPLIVVTTTAFASYFVFGPIWNIFESMFGASMSYVAKAPLGIGVGLFGAMWQVAVVFGLHTVFGIISMLDMLSNQGFTKFGATAPISAWAQFGALLGVVLITKDKKLQKEGKGYLISGFMGITEPTLYGVNLPRKTPLIAGALSTFIIGCIFSMLNVTQRVVTGMGVFETIGYFSGTALGGVPPLGNLENGLIFTAGLILSIVLAAAFSILMWKERPSEKSQFIILINKLVKLVKLQNNLTKEEVETLNSIKKELINSLSKEEIKFIKQKQKEMLQIVSMQEEINSIIDKEEKIKTKILTKGKKAVSKNNTKLANELVIKYNSISNADQIKNIEQRKNDAIEKFNVETYLKFSENISKKVLLKIDQLKIKNEITIDSDIANNVFNIFNSLLITYNIIEKKENIFKIENELKKTLANNKKINKNI